jgi:DnaK suppressor protein
VDTEDDYLSFEFAREVALQSFRYIGTLARRLNICYLSRLHIMEKLRMALKKVVADKTAAFSTLPVSGFKPYEPKEGEKYMSEAQHEHFRQILRAWKRELMEEVDRTVDHMKTDAANFADPADRATQEEEFSLELRTRDRERKLIKKIDESLNLIETGEYGYCEACGIEIGIRRLEARPTATLCIDCKTLQEIKEKQLSA